VVDHSEININILSKAMENGRIAHTPSKEQLNQIDYDFNKDKISTLSRQSSSEGSDGFLQVSHNT